MTQGRQSSRATLRRDSECLFIDPASLLAERHSHRSLLQQAASGEIRISSPMPITRAAPDRES